jgi:hypothetical protein
LEEQPLFSLFNHYTVIIGHIEKKIKRKKWRGGKADKSVKSYRKRINMDVFLKVSQIYLILMYQDGSFQA